MLKNSLDFAIENRILPVFFYPFNFFRMDQQDTRPFYQSATKIVFVILTVALVVGMFV